MIDWIKKHSTTILALLHLAALIAIWVSIDGWGAFTAEIEHDALSAVATAVATSLAGAGG